MLHTTTATRGMVTAPHHLAAESGLAVLREGGNAIEAMVAAAATIAVVYPHMNSIGGDGFWLIKSPGEAPVGIDACGAAGGGVTPALYRSKGFETVPSRGPLAANTVAGTVSGWDFALQLSNRWGGALPLKRLLQDAIWYAEHGVPVTSGQAALTCDKLDELKDVPGFATTFLVDGKPRKPYSLQHQPRLAATLKGFADRGLDDFYRGTLASAIAADLSRAGSPLTGDDLAGHHAHMVEPFEIELSIGKVYNLPPPTQGLASLLVLGIFDRLGIDTPDDFRFVHGLVEAAKLAFEIRDRDIGDPVFRQIKPETFLSDGYLGELASRVSFDHALVSQPVAREGDTIWMGSIDRAGRAVSFIQSLYWEYGSGVVLEETGIQWQNRGCSFRLEEGMSHSLEPGRKPFHTLNPALAVLSDGRVMPYGAMGGDGQPQTQAAILTRHAWFNTDLQTAISAPRWLYGRTWGAQSTTLKLESRFSKELIDELHAMHDVEVVEAFDYIMGHAGALVLHPDGLIEGASDPRSDGRAAGF